MAAILFFTTFGNETALVFPSSVLEPLLYDFAINLNHLEPVQTGLVDA